MPPRGFTNPAPKTDSARSALNSFTCNLCNKSYSRHPEYEAHISSYDHQHKKRLRDLKQLSRDPNAAEKARKAERKADAEAGLLVVGTTQTPTGGKNSASGGFKKGGFKSSFAVVSGGSNGGPSGKGAPTTGPSLTRKNVLGDDDDEDISKIDRNSKSDPRTEQSASDRDVESDTDQEYGEGMFAYYDPQKPTGCSTGCKGMAATPAA